MCRGRKAVRRGAGGAVHRGAEGPGGAALTALWATAAAVGLGGVGGRGGEEGGGGGGDWGDIVSGTTRVKMRGEDKIRPPPCMELCFPSI